VFLSPFLFDVAADEAITQRFLDADVHMRMMPEVRAAWPHWAPIAVQLKGAMPLIRERSQGAPRWSA
jgi:5,10-methylenetetrahydrofolate reductase